MVNFGEPSTVPEKYKGRRFYQHNPQVTLMRTNGAESARLGAILAEKCNLARGPLTVVFPTRGFSVIGGPGGPFQDPEADEALRLAWKTGLRRDLRFIEFAGNINDSGFAETCVRELLRSLPTPKQPQA